MEETKKNSKGLIVLVIILIICILGLGGYIVYDKMLNKQTKTTDNTKSSTTKSTQKQQSIEEKNYEINKTNIFATILAENKENYDYPLGKKNSDKDGNIWLSYPQINYQTESVINLNKKIKDNIEDNVKRIENGENSFDTDDLQCYLIKLKKDNKTYKYERLNYNAYSIIENDNHISIIKYDISSTDCASGYVNESETYIIDKNTKKVLTLEEIISSYKNYTDMIDILKKYINDNYDKLYSNDLYEKNKIIYDVEDSLKNNNYSLYYNNNDELIIIITPLIGEGMTSTFIYLNNEWKEYNDEISGTLW